MNPTLREASLSDIRTLGRHHRKMFQEIWKNRGTILTPERSEAVEKAYAEKIKKELPNGLCKVWVIEEEGKIIASGAITIVSLVPTPIDLGSHAVWLHSMYTEKKHRGEQHAQRIIKKALHYCKKKGFKRVLLNASDSGRPIYEKLGFQPSPDTMRFLIK